MSIVTRFFPILIGAVGLASTALLPSASAQTWTEAGDAGDLLSNAQTTIGTGALTAISGTLFFNAEADMYCITVTDAPNFSATFACTVQAAPDLWLFDANGFGVSLDDNCFGGQVALTGANVSTPGTYYLALSKSDWEAHSVGGAIWDPPVALGDRAPDGPGAASPHTSWVGIVPATAHVNYTVTLTGAAFCDAPVSAEVRSWSSVKVRYP